MMQKSRRWMVAGDLFWIQLIWSLWAVLIVGAIYIVRTVFAVRAGEGVEDFLAFTFGSAKSYMLIIGIIGTYHFIKFYISHGVTRKEYYQGAVIGVAALALVLAGIVGLLSGLEHAVFRLFDLSDMLHNYASADAVKQEGNVILALLPATLLGESIFGASANWIVALLVYAAVTFIYYLAGWLIGAGYRRFGGMLGTLLTLLTIYVMVGLSALWGDTILKPLSYLIPWSTGNLPIAVSIAGTLLLIALMLWLIQVMTRRVVVKM